MLRSFAIVFGLILCLTAGTYGVVRAQQGPDPFSTPCSTDNWCSNPTPTAAPIATPTPAPISTGSGDQAYKTLTDFISKITNLGTNVFSGPRGTGAETSAITAAIMGLELGLVFVISLFAFNGFELFKVGRTAFATIIVGAIVLVVIQAMPQIAQQLLALPCYQSNTITTAITSSPGVDCSRATSNDFAVYQDGLAYSGDIMHVKMQDQNGGSINPFAAAAAVVGTIIAGMLATCAAFVVLLMYVAIGTAIILTKLALNAFCFVAIIKLPYLVLRSVGEVAIEGKNLVKSALTTSFALLGFWVSYGLGNGLVGAYFDHLANDGATLMDLFLAPLLPALWIVVTVILMWVLSKAAKGAGFSAEGLASNVLRTGLGAGLNLAGGAIGAGGSLLKMLGGELGNLASSRRPNSKTSGGSGVDEEVQDAKFREDNMLGTRRIDALPGGGDTSSDPRSPLPGGGGNGKILALPAPRKDNGSDAGGTSSNEPHPSTGAGEHGSVGDRRTTDIDDAVANNSSMQIRESQTTASNGSKFESTMSQSSSVGDAITAMPNSHPHSAENRPQTGVPSQKDLSNASKLDGATSRASNVGDGVIAKPSSSADRPRTGVSTSTTTSSDAASAATIRPGSASTSTARSVAPQSGSPRDGATLHLPPAQPVSSATQRPSANSAGLSDSGSGTFSNATSRVGSSSTVDNTDASVSSDRTLPASTSSAGTSSGADEDFLDARYEPVPYSSPDRTTMDANVASYAGDAATIGRPDTFDAVSDPEGGVSASDRRRFYIAQARQRFMSGVFGAAFTVTEGARDAHAEMTGQSRGKPFGTGILDSAHRGSQLSELIASPLTGKLKAQYFAEYQREFGADPANRPPFDDWAQKHHQAVQGEMLRNYVMQGTVGRDALQRRRMNGNA